jgi:hypothetical protein
LKEIRELKDRLREAERQRDEATNVLRSALKIAEFENHAFRHWHDEARAFLSNTTKP